jgi:hypothetical protein
MSTENQGRDSRRLSSPKKLGKLGAQKKSTPKKVVEQVPDWLQQLLSRHGEPAGPLIGLEEESFIEDEKEIEPLPDAPPAPVSEETAHLSALLEQMAEEGPPELADDQVATSVEWGDVDTSAQEPPAAPIDEVLVGISQVQDEEEQEDLSDQVSDWISDLMPGESTEETAYHEDIQPTQPGVTSQDDASEWLTEVISPAETTTSPTPPPAPAADEDVPDWLTAALETPTAPDEGAPPPPQPPAPSTAEEEEEVPDWLTAALETPTAPDEGAEVSPPPPAQPSVPPTVDEDVPDWLTAALDVPSAATETPPAVPRAAVASDEDRPDWLSEPATPEVEDHAAPLEPAATTDTPDWLDSMAPEAVSMGGAGEVETTAFADDQALEPAMDEPDWLAEIAPPTVDAPESRPFTKADVVPATQEQPDWLSDSALETTEPTRSSPEVGQPVPTWLENIYTPSPPRSVLAAPTVPKWLENIQAPAESSPVSSTQPPAWLEELQTESGDAVPTVTDVVQPPTAATETPLSPAPEPTFEVEDETPVRPVDTLDFDTEPAPETPKEAEPVAKPVSKLKRVKPLKRLSPRAVSPSLPDWVASLIPSGAEMGTLTQPLPEWVANLIPPVATGTEVSSAILPDWAKVLVPPGFEIKTEAAPPRPGLKKLLKPADTPKAEPGVPDWIADLSPPEETPASAAPVDTIEPETGVEMPDWLTDAAQPEEAPVPTAPVDTTESELDLPD